MARSATFWLHCPSSDGVDPRDGPFCLIAGPQLFTVGVEAGIGSIRRWSFAPWVSSNWAETKLLHRGCERSELPRVRPDPQALAKDQDSRPAITLAEIEDFPGASFRLTTPPDWGVANQLPAGPPKTKIVIGSADRSLKSSRYFRGRLLGLSGQVETQRCWRLSHSETNGILFG